MFQRAVEDVLLIVKTHVQSIVQQIASADVNEHAEVAVVKAVAAVVVNVLMDV